MRGSHIKDAASLDLGQEWADHLQTAIRGASMLGRSIRGDAVVRCFDDEAEARSKPDLYLNRQKLPAPQEDRFRLLA